ncbi:MAG: RNA polymerase sigma factor [Planctomycetaceae bacterium]
MKIADRPDPDLDIVSLAGERSTRRAAMGVLYERFRERVYNTALRVVGDSGEAADVLQDVFVLLFRKIHRFRAQSFFAAWVYRITVNVSLDRLRQRRRRPALNLDSAALDAIRDGEDLSHPEQAATQRDLEVHVRTALESLSPRLRIVVVLRYLEGLAYHDIAEVLGCSVGTVKSRLNRAHSQLRGLLAGRYMPGASGTLTA